jgi:Zn-dependent protease with chaperone function
MRAAALFLILILALTAFPPAHAQPEPEGQAVQADSGRVPVPQPSEKAMRYYRSGNVLWAVSTLWGLLVPILLLFTGLSARMRDAARRIGRNWFFTLAVYSILFSLVVTAINLPLAYYSDFVRQHEYGLSTQTLGKWVSDLVKGTAVGLLVGALTIWLPYLLIRKSPRHWWLYTGLLAAPFLAFTLLVSPVWIDPLFNEFGPMKDKALEARILSLADRAGIAGSRIFEVNKSVDTETVNAYVAGFLNTKRIVLWDTILRKLSAPEVLFVMGHEMGHYVLGHILWLIGLMSALILFTLYVIHRSAQRLIERFRGRFGFSELADVASLPLILLLFNLTLLVVTPAVLAITRHNEHESDRFGLEITRDNRHCATAFAKLQRTNLGNPRPGLLYKLWRSSHPPLGERIDFCNEYRPWETGGELRYGDLIDAQE